MTTSYRVGIIAQRHAKAYQSVSGFHLASAAEPNPETARAFQETFTLPIET